MSDFHADTADLHLDCQTCLAANTTACSDCIVTHLLANDDGPIELVAVSLGGGSDEGALPRDVARAVDLLAKAGLVDDPPEWVDRSEFGPVATVAAR